MTIHGFRKRATTYGTDDFTAALAAREAALGLSAPDFADVAETTGLDVADVAPSEPEPAEDAPEPRGNERRDKPWGNVIISGPRLNGAYVIRHWLNNRTVYVCGAPEQHVQQGYWRRDGRMDGNGQGYICSQCHTIESGLYGIAERR